ncbi:MAG: hypothetical protein IKM52_05975 [Clostridia bacterium]|nr:hypothetical protein [Clostridia bacterium]
MCFKKRKNHALPFFFLGMAAAAALYLVYRFMTKKCRAAEKAVQSCMADSLFCDCEKDSDR